MDAISFHAYLPDAPVLLVTVNFFFATFLFRVLLNMWSKLKG